MINKEKINKMQNIIPNSNYRIREPVSLSELQRGTGRFREMKIGDLEKVERDSPYFSRKVIRS